MTNYVMGYQHTALIRNGSLLYIGVCLNVPSNHVTESNHDYLSLTTISTSNRAAIRQTRNKINLFESYRKGFTCYHAHSILVHFQPF